MHQRDPAGAARPRAGIAGPIFAGACGVVADAGGASEGTAGMMGCEGVVKLGFGPDKLGVSGMVGDVVDGKEVDGVLEGNVGAFSDGDPVCNVDEAPGCNPTLGVRPAGWAPITPVGVITPGVAGTVGVGLGATFGALAEVDALGGAARVLVEVCA